MKTLPLFIAVFALGLTGQSHAQVLTTGEPATVTGGDRALPGTPQSMTVADEGASSGYIIGKRVNPDKKKKQTKSTLGASTRDTAAMTPYDKPAPNRKARKPKVRRHPDQ